MTDQDQLAEIKRQLSLTPPDPRRDEIDRWLVGEVEQARRDRDDMHQNVMRLQDKIGSAIEREQAALAEVERLRGLLERLVDHFACPVCGQRQHKDGQTPNCWLAREIHSVPS